MWTRITQALLDLLKVMGQVGDWLSRPIGDDPYYTRPLGFQILERLGVEVDWIFQLSPLQILTSSLVSVLGVVLLVRLIGMILKAIPIL